MALKDLLTALEADAAAETERLRAEADAEALRIVESAKLEARALEEQAARVNEAELGRELERRRSEARLTAAAMLRDEHEACVATLQAALRRRLAALRETDDYAAVLDKLGDPVELWSGGTDTLSDCTAGYGLISLYQYDNYPAWTDTRC